MNVAITKCVGFLVHCGLNCGLRQWPGHDALLAVGATVIAGVALAGAENKGTPAKDHQPTD
ncbi:MAG: hypothetical protein OXF25_07795 [Cyanobacteria bacterium MAG CAR3_bin_5]|nr:hypothetical protein [Cyanobacteria bacterium MAG CAR3_bin_5]